MRWKNFAMMIACAALMIGSAFAQGIVVPGDSDGDKIVSAEEVAAAEKLAQEGKLSADELKEIKHIYERYPRTIVDSANRSVTIYKPIKSIIFTTRGNYEALRTLRVPMDMIIGISNDVVEAPSYHPEFNESNLPTIGKYEDVDMEKVLELNPDVVLAHPGAKLSPYPFIQQLESAGVTVLCFELHVPEPYPEEIRKLGYVLEREDEAQAFLEFYNGLLDSIRTKTKDIPEENQPRIYCEIKTSSGKYYRSHPEYDKYSIALAGGKDIFPTEPFGEVDVEAVMKRNPDAIVRVVVSGTDELEAGYIDELKAARDDVMNRPELQNVTAVKTGKVFTIATPIWGAYGYAGGRHFVSIAYLAKWFHPDLFKDLDPEAIHQEYLTKFQGLDYDLKTRGVFVYHPEYHPDGE
jgi:iron complex transport system substrate-binding protein